jgi:hypothetical protein
VTFGAILGFDMSFTGASSFLRFHWLNAQT